MKKISLIICFYNAEEFIDRALKSFIDFLTDEIEVILVDDGSTDNSLEIVNKYIGKHKELILVQQEVNAGLSLARKIGVESSSGDHIMFLDADDEFIRDPFSFFLNRNDLSKVDIFEYGAITDLQETYLNSYYEYEKVIQGSIYLDDYFRSKHNKYVMLWLRLIRRDLFFPTAFSEKFKIHEDNMSLPLIISRSKDVKVLNEIFLKINSNPNSITRAKFSKKNKLNKIQKLKTRAKFYKEIINHLNMYFPIEKKDDSFNRYIIELSLAHVYCLSSTGFIKAFKEHREVKRVIPKKVLFKHKYLYLIDSKFNFFLMFFGFNLTTTVALIYFRVKLILSIKE
jgi:glycosyltransferase involved in cell wall biosynthesis